MSTPAWQPLPPPPPQKSNTTRTVLIVVGSILLLCCVGGIVGGIFLFRGVKTAVGPVQDTTDQFVTDLEQGDTTAAYALLCQDTQSAFPQTTFAEGVNSQPKISSHKIDGAMIRDVNGSTSATVTASLTMSTGFVDHHTFTLVKEGGGWRVCGSPY